MTAQSLNYINAVYYPSWRVYKGLPPSSLRLDCVTHVLYAFVRINEDGSLRFADERADIVVPVDGEKGGLAALAKAKRENPHIRTLISVGGGSGSAEFPALAGNPQARAKFATEVEEFVAKWSFDGVDIDWEHPSTTQQGKDYVSLLQALRAVLPPPYLVVSALPTAEYVLKHIDLPAVADLVSFVNLMAYDFTGLWAKAAGHHAQLMACPHAGTGAPTKCASTGVDYLRDHGIPSEKIVLGVPTYARCFSQAREPGHAFKGASLVEYRDLDEVCVRDATVHVAAAAASYVDEAGFASDKGKRSEPLGFMSFDVPETVRAKGQYVKTARLGGLFYWTGTGDRDGSESLVAAGFAELGADSAASSGG
ncbi:glycoside hydrolase superfamily [Lasiosphaeria ovina]|uniref:chitinase n=1 Tax=Lasiosphaeria ovina TaxID=92902 RepID=A0AAE0KI36_9PEZI|nr:glycoside hydrolase superfamily [Lasiosphaeria ovina]